jgi:hypothetical protein
MIHGFQAKWKKFFCIKGAHYLTTALSHETWTEFLISTPQRASRSPNIENLRAFFPVDTGHELF